MIPIRKTIVSFSALAALIIAHIVTVPTATALDPTSQLNTYIKTSLDTYQIPGASAVIQKDGKTLLQNSWGHSSDGSKLTTDTPFLIGSLSKPITASAILLLAQDKTIRLDEPIKTYLPNFRYSSKSNQQITVRHLLEQTSGISPSDGLNVTDRSYKQPGAISQAVTALNNVTLQSTPGTAYSYTSANYLLLGAIIESASNKSYSEFVTTRIFAPLAMDHTSATQQDSSDDGLVSGYSSWIGHPIKSSGFYDNSGAPYGYISSTASDIMKFLQFMQNGGVILSDQSMQLFKTITKEKTYGIGWFYSPESKYFYHGGATPDFRAEMFYYPDRDFSGVILTNKYHSLEDQQVADIANGMRAIADNQTQDQLPAQSYIIQWSIISVIILLAVWSAYIIYGLFKSRKYHKLRDKIVGVVLAVIAIGLPFMLPYIF
ncbi:MAG: class A beta-lactamase-related serine hydrolase, partial [Chitinophagaceae bacterium]